MAEQKTTLELIQDGAEQFFVAPGEGMILRCHRERQEDVEQEAAALELQIHTLKRDSFMKAARLLAMEDIPELEPVQKNYQALVREGLMKQSEGDEEVM